MSKKETVKTECEILSNIDAKLSAILSVMLRNNPDIFSEDKVVNNMTTAVGFLASCGLADDESAKILKSTKDSVRKMREKYNKDNK